MVQSLDVLTVGPIAFLNFSPPAQMPGGGEQRTAKHLLLGGNRVIDVLGADPSDRTWQGFWFEAAALSYALTLDALRIAGQPVTMSWGAETRLVIVTKFEYKVEKFNYVHYSITCMIADNTEAGGGGLSSFDSLIGGDLSSVLSLSSLGQAASAALSAIGIA